MYKKILIISSNITGHGHKSITESMLEQFQSHYPEVQIKVIEGFSLNGNMGLKIGKMYGSITRTSKEAWKLIWDITEKRPEFIVELSEVTIIDRLVKLLNEFKPDAVITTHPNYNTSITSILERVNLDIPLFAVVADPVTISPLWCNAKARYTLCPTEEAKQTCLKCNVPEDRIRVFGFPVRQRFYSHLTRTGDGRYVDVSQDSYTPGNPLRFFIMSGGEGSGNMSRQAKILLKNFNCTVRILCGRNKLLKKRLEHTLFEKYPDRVEILGFTDKVQELMLASDIMFARASPNTMMEAVMCNVPLVITGALPGQEEGNPGYAVKYGLGVVCTAIPELKATVTDLLANHYEKLLAIRKSQAEYRNPDSARNIVDFVMTH
jgi:processive 1,2-diacylglycerol beta-glucosyltransferase